MPASGPVCCAQGLPVCSRALARSACINVIADRQGASVDSVLSTSAEADDKTVD